MCLVLNVQVVEDRNFKRIRISNGPFVSSVILGVLCPLERRSPDAAWDANTVILVPMPLKRTFLSSRRHFSSPNFPFSQS